MEWTPEGTWCAGQIAEYPVSKEKIQFILTYCHILKISEEDKMKHIAARAMSEWVKDPGFIVAVIRKLLKALGKQDRGASPAPYNTTWNSDNLC